MTPAMNPDTSAPSKGITTMRITQTYDRREARDGALASGMDRGMEARYKQRDEVLARPA
jgi:hypothetical protein